MHIKILKTSKKALLALFAFCSVFFAYTEQYKISETHYDIQGITREYPLKTKVEVDYHKIFENEEELLGYIKDLKQRLENTRAFEEINIDFSVLEATEEGIYPVKVFIKTKDAKHLLALPYPKFDSNSGFLFKLKAKDTNFLGSLEEMAGELNFQIESDKDPWEYTTGLAFSFETPFKAGPFKEVLTNDHSFSYTIGKNTPEWNFKVGLTSELPFEKYSIKFDFVQSFIRDLDYEIADINGKAKYYGDGTYFTEDAKISVPLIIQDIENWGKLYYTPYTQMVYYWDFDGIHKDNTDLQSPKIVIGQTISTSRINWEGNFRKGASINVNQTFSYNIYRGKFIPGIEAEFQGFTHSKYIGLNADFLAFAYLNDTKKIGSRLRGIKDDLYFAEETGMSDTKASDVNGGIVLNIDFPIHIITTNWSKVPLIKKIGFFDKYFNFELQISPFIDIALVHNKVNNRSLHYKDGFYTAGLEILVFPLKWKGLVVRASFGVDLGRTIPGFKGKLDQHWRDDVSKYELTIGLGLHY